MNILIGFLTAVHVLVALFLIVLVLMQKSSEQGVGAAFGGGMTDTVFGGGTTTALVRMTIWCACIMLATTLILAVLHSRHGATGGSLMQKVIEQPVTMPSSASQPPLFPVPETPATPAAASPNPATTPAPAPDQTPPPAPAPAGKTP
jgi:preprotein translocase subunit SecG